MTVNSKATAVAKDNIFACGNNFVAAYQADELIAIRLHGSLSRRKEQCWRSGNANILFVVLNRLATVALWMKEESIIRWIQSKYTNKEKGKSMLATTYNVFNGVVAKKISRLRRSFLLSFASISSEVKGMPYLAK